MTKSNKTTSKTANADAFGVMEAEIVAQLDAISKRRSKPKRAKPGKGDDPDKMAMATAALARSLISLQGERRQRDKFEIRALESFSLDAIAARLKRLPEAKRRDFCRDVIGEDDGEPLL